MTTDLENEQDQIIRYVVSEVSCNNCGGPYVAQDVFVLDRDEHTWMLVAHCPTCDMYGLVIAIMGDEQSEHAGGYIEQSSIASVVTPIGDQEVQRWRDFLDGFEGDMYDLLAL